MSTGNPSGVRGGLITISLSAARVGRDVRRLIYSAADVCELCAPGTHRRGREMASLTCSRRVSIMLW